MALKIRLRQHGKTNRLTYRFIVTDSRSPRDGKYLEMVGSYNPHVEGDKDTNLFPERIQYWIGQGAEMSDKVKSLVARSAPEVIKEITDRQEAKKKKLAEKRKKKTKK